MKNYNKKISKNLAYLVFKYEFNISGYLSLDDLKNFFRIEYQLLIDVNFDYNAGKKFVIIITKMNTDEFDDNTYHISGVDFLPMYFSDYFQALEIGLFEAFKIIFTTENDIEFIEKEKNEFLKK